MDQNIQNDELDIEHFASGSYRLMKKVANKLFYPFCLLAYKPVMLLINLAIVIVVAFLLQQLLPKVYEATFVMKPLNRADVFFINQLEDMEQLIHDQDEAVIASELGIPANDAAALKKMEVEIIWRGKDKDTINLVLVTLRATDPKVFNSVQASLLSYLERNPHYARMKELRKAEIASMRKKFTDDMHEIDSVKKLMAQSISPRNSGGFVFGEPIDPVRLYQEGLNLYRQNLGLDWQQEFIDNFELVKPCIAASRPAWPRFTPIATVFIALGLLITMMQNHRKIKQAKA